MAHGGTAESSAQGAQLFISWSPEPPQTEGGNIRPPPSVHVASQGAMRVGRGVPFMTRPSPPGPLPTRSVNGR